MRSCPSRASSTGPDRSKIGQRGHVRVVLNEIGAALGEQGQSLRNCPDLLSRLLVKRAGLVGGLRARRRLCRARKAGSGERSPATVHVASEQAAELGRAQPAVAEDPEQGDVALAVRRASVGNATKV